MDASDEKKIRQFQSENSRDINLILMTDGSGFSREATLFADKLRELIVSLRVKKEPVGTDEYPGFYIGTNLSCHFLPSGPKLDQFLTALKFSNSFESADLAKTEAFFGTSDLPADLRLYIAEGCPHCHRVLSTLLPLPFINRKIRLRIFDPLFFPNLAEKDAVRSVPTIILDQDFRWTGAAIELPELARVITSRDPRMLSTGSLDMLLKEGDAQRLVEMFQKNAIIYPAFIELLTHPTWSTRLGAMVVMETLIESDPIVAAQIQSPIWAEFETVADTVKGDLLYIIGELGLKEDIARLKAISDGKYSSDVKEAANEALAKMRNI
jgi:glutaredoxin